MAKVIRYTPGPSEKFLGSSGVILLKEIRSTNKSVQTKDTVSPSTKINSRK